MLIGTGDGVDAVDPNADGESNSYELATRQNPQANSRAMVRDHLWPGWFLVRISTRTGGISKPILLQRGVE